MLLKESFEKEIKQKIKKDLELKSISEVPAIEKIVINMGVGSNRDNKKFIEEAKEDMTLIGGQKVTERPAKSSISNFKLRKGQLAGLTVTLRDKKMWDFYEKLVTIVMPRVRDFQGLNEKSFDGHGNYNIGLREQTVFPEIDANKTAYNKPLQVTISTTATTDEMGHKLLSELGMPFRNMAKKSK